MKQHCNKTHDHLFPRAVFPSSEKHESDSVQGGSLELSMSKPLHILPTDLQMLQKVGLLGLCVTVTMQ